MLDGRRLVSGGRPDAGKIGVDEQGAHGAEGDDEENEGQARGQLRMPAGTRRQL
jgi:hypothetical protein